MLRRDEVEPLLGEITRLRGQLDELLARFNGAGHGTRARDFLLWLEAQGLLTRAELARLSDPDGITVTLHRPRREPADDATLARGANLQRPPAPIDSERYVLLGHAGRGGMATVHIARDTELMRRVAYKSLLLEEAESAPNELTPEERFIREVQITAQLDHPHIVPVYSLEVHADGRPAYTMKLVEGRTLSAYLDDTRAFYQRGVAPDEAHELPARLEYFLKVCDAIHYAHTKGIVHRDLKPANIMIGRHNEVYVMDWGICRLLSETAAARQTSPLFASSDSVAAQLPTDAARTQDGSLMGTPRYMSPEQASGRQSAVGPASDQCALGLILFELVTLAAPFEGATTLDVLRSAVRGLNRPIVHAHTRQTMARELVAIIRKATAVAPDSRYANVNELADDLRRYLRGAAVLARPDSPWQAASRWFARHRQAALALSSSLVVIALAIAAQWFTLQEEHRILQREHRAEQRAAARERGLREILNAITLRREQLTAVLLKTESGVERLAAAAEQALLYGTASKEPYYTGADRDDPKRAPTLTSDPVWSFPSSVTPASAAQRIQRIHRLRDHRGELFAEVGALMGAAGKPSAALNVHLVLADGVTSTYPATSNLTADFDARSSPWYALDRDSNAHWHPPHASPSHAQRVLAVTSTVRGKEDEGIGVAALLLSADEVARALLRPEGIPNATRLLLIDAEGEVILDSEPTPSLTPAWSQDAALLRDLRSNHLGYRQIRLGDEPYLAVHSRLQIADWSLLALIDDPRLLPAP